MPYLKPVKTFYSSCVIYDDVFLLNMAVIFVLPRALICVARWLSFCRCVVVALLDTWYFINNYWEVFSGKNEHRFLLDEFDLQTCTCAVVDSLNYCLEWS